MSVSTYLNSEVDEILAPILDALAKEQPHGSEAIRKAIIRIADGRNTEYVDTLDGLKAKDSVDPYREVILIPALARNEYPTEMIEGFRKRHANGEKMCQMVQRVTKEMFDADKDKVSGGPGNWTVRRAMNSGMTHPTCMMGCHVGDTESYDTFIGIYKPLVEGYHQMEWKEGNSTPKSCLDPAKLTAKFSP